MKIRAREGGEVVEIGDEGAQTLIDAGIYDAVEPTDKEPAKAPAPKTPAPRKSSKKPTEKSTKVAPMTTEDMPSPARKGA